jgi:hypothetical protein
MDGTYRFSFYYIFILIIIHSERKLDIYIQFIIFGFFSSGSFRFIYFIRANLCLTNELEGHQRIQSPKHN